MKNLILTFTLLFVATIAMNSASAQIDKGAKIEFSKETHDYGTIKYDADPYCTFEFKNTGLNQYELLGDNKLIGNFNLGNLKLDKKAVVILISFLKNSLDY